MGFWSWWRGLFSRSQRFEHDDVVHDFTYAFKGHAITLWKPLNDSTRVFMVGEGTRPKEGEFIVMYHPLNSCMVYYRLSNVRCEKVGSWRAYGTQQARGSLKASKPASKVPDVSVVRRPRVY